MGKWERAKNENPNAKPHPDLLLPNPHIGIAPVFMYYNELRPRVGESLTGVQPLTNIEVLAWRLNFRRKIHSLMIELIYDIDDALRDIVRSYRKDG